MTLYKSSLYIGMSPIILESVQKQLFESNKFTLHSDTIYSGVFAVKFFICRGDYYFIVDRSTRSKIEIEKEII